METLITTNHMSVWILPYDHQSNRSIGEIGEIEVIILDVCLLNDLGVKVVKGYGKV